MIFPKIAVYRALLAGHPDDAMRIMEAAVAEEGRQNQKWMGSITANAAGRSLFMKMFKVGVQKLFGEKAGFRQENYRAGKGFVCMDIVQCPYYSHCLSEGVPELAHTFCNSDDYNYGHLPGIRFQRSGTLARGNDRCDFHIDELSGDSSNA